MTTALYVPPTDEADHKKQNQSLQLIGGIVANLNAGKLPGTTTNDNATAGNIGEYTEGIVTSASPVSITTASATNITSISLTAGDWDVNAIGLINPAVTTSVSVFETSLSSTSATRNTNPGFFAQVGNLGVVGSVYFPTNAVTNARFSLSATTTIYLVAFTSFTVSTNVGFGMLRARRAR